MVKATTVLRRINRMIRHMIKEDKSKQYGFECPFSQCKIFIMF